MRRFDPSLAQVDWLAHRWEISVQPVPITGVEKFQIVIGRLTLALYDSKSAAEEARAALRVESVAEVAARHPRLHDARAAIEAMSGKARLPRHLWPSYDAIALQGEPGGTLTLLSAKARAMFSGDLSTFIRLRR